MVGGDKGGDHASDPGGLRHTRTQNLVRASARVARTRRRVTAWLRDTAACAPPTSAYLSASVDTFAWQPPDHSQLDAHRR